MSSKKYSQVIKSYKLCNPITKKLIVSHDVTFDEQKAWEWNSNEGKSVVPDLINNEEFEEQSTN